MHFLLETILMVAALGAAGGMLLLSRRRGNIEDLSAAYLLALFAWVPFWIAQELWHPFTGHYSTVGFPPFFWLLWIAALLVTASAFVSWWDSFRRLPVVQILGAVLVLYALLYQLFTNGFAPKGSIHVTLVGTLFTIGIVLALAALVLFVLWLFKRALVALGVVAGVLALLAGIFFVIGATNVHHDHKVTAQSPAAPGTSSSSSPSASPSGSATSNGGKGGIPGGGTAQHPRKVALGEPGPGNFAPANQILADLRTQKPGGEDFQFTYDQTELTMLATAEENWLKTHAGNTCVQSLAASFNVSAKALPGFMQSHLVLREVKSADGLTAQNSFCDPQGKLQWWDVQTFPQHELVWFDKASGDPAAKYVCLNRLRKVVVHQRQSPTPAQSTPNSPKPTPTTSTPTPTPKPTTSSPKPTPTTSTPTPTPKPTTSSPTPTPKAPSISVTSINDVDAGGTSPNFCATVNLPGSDSGTLFFSSVYGSFSTSTFTVNGMVTRCVTYRAPTEVPPGGKDTVTVTVRDNHTGLSAQRSQTFPINNPPPPPA